MCCLAGNIQRFSSGLELGDAFGCTLHAAYVLSFSNCVQLTHCVTLPFNRKTCSSRKLEPTALLAHWHTAIMLSLSAGCTSVALQAVFPAPWQAVHACRLDYHWCAVHIRWVPCAVFPAQTSSSSPVVCLLRALAGFACQVGMLKRPTLTLEIQMRGVDPCAW